MEAVGIFVGGLGSLAVWGLPPLPLVFFLTVAVVVGLMRRYSPQVYDAVIIHMTARWYEAVLEKLPANSRVLDVGIGTATALLENSHLVREKKLTVAGLDYDKAYVDAAEVYIQEAEMTDFVSVRCLSVYDDALAELKINGQPFDAAYFSGSFSLMPDPAGALRAVCKVLKPGGLIYITQTYQKPSALNPLLARLKPWLKYLTTIDFGQLVYEQTVLDTFASLEPDGVVRVLHEKIPGSLDNALQAAWISVLRRPK